MNLELLVLGHIGLSLLPKVYAVLHYPLVMKITYIGLKHGQTIYQKDILELIGLENFSQEIILYKIVTIQRYSIYTVHINLSNLK